MTTVPRSKAVIGIVLVAAMVSLAACDPVIGNPSGPIRHAALTSDSGMTFHYTGDHTVVFAQPGSPSSDINVREVFWYPDSKYAADQQVCMNWNTVATAFSSGLLQPGVAMRIAPVTADNKGIKAITVTQNVYFGAIWLFNVHVWNSLNRGHAFTQIAQFDLTPIVGSLLKDGMFDPWMVPAPWHVCARTKASSFAFMVWTGSESQPSWTDSARVFTTHLPAGWNYPGYVGGYMGHLHPGQAAAFTNVMTELQP